MLGRIRFFLICGFARRRVEIGVVCLLQLDATAFGHLAPFWFVPVESELKKFFGSECTNLVDLIERIKSVYWPDWDQAVGQLSLDTDWKNPAGGDDKKTAAADGDNAKMEDAAAGAEKAE